jgi:hypothetical protein
VALVVFKINQIIEQIDTAGDQAENNKGKKGMQCVCIDKELL